MSITWVQSRGIIIAQPRCPRVCVSQGYLLHTVQCNAQALRTMPSFFTGEPSLTWPDTDQCKLYIGLNLYIVQVQAKVRLG